MRLSAIVLFTVLGASGLARADQVAVDKGNQHYRAAQEQYRAGRYLEAVAELRLAHAADPEPGYLYGIGAAYKQAGDCEHAIESFGAFLRTGPTSSVTKTTQLLIDECNAILADRAKAATSSAPSTQPLPAPPPVVTTPPPASAPLIIREIQRVHTREVAAPWYLDWKGDALAGAGLAGLLTGALFLVAANGHDEDAANALTYDAVDRAERARDRDQLIGGVALTAGGALVVGALVRYALRPKRTQTELFVEPTDGGATAGVSWGAW